MTIADRVRERLDALDLNPAETARRAGLGRTFIHDLLAGKKKSIRGTGLSVLASTLECDAEYLLGEQATPRRPFRDASERRTVHENSDHPIPVLGICEAGVWRTDAAHLDLGTFPIRPDLRFPGRRQVAFLARGDGASRIGISDGMIVVGIEPDEDDDGSVEIAGAPLVVRQTRPDGSSETSIRMIEVGTRGAMLVAPSASDRSYSLIQFPGQGVSILAVITRAVRLYGLPS